MNPAAPVTDMFQWCADNAAVFRVVRLADGAQVARIEAPAFFAFHFVNAYEEGAEDGEEGGDDGEDAPCAAGSSAAATAAAGVARARGRIVVDCCAYTDPGVIRDLFLGRLRAGDFSTRGTRLRRFVLDLAVGAAEERALPLRVIGGLAAAAAAAAVGTDASADEGLLGEAVSFELPSVAPRAAGRPYRFAYAVRASPGTYVDGLLKLDLARGEARSWQQVGCSPSEPVFVPRRLPREGEWAGEDEEGGADGEDDGVVVSIVLAPSAEAAAGEGASGVAEAGAVAAAKVGAAAAAGGGAAAPPTLGGVPTSFVLVLDARSFREVARAPLPDGWVCPMTFHGSFMRETGH